MMNIKKGDDMSLENEAAPLTKGITMTEAIEAIRSNRTEDRQSLMDRVWASTKHPEKVINLDEIRLGRARAERLIRALEAG